MTEPTNISYSTVLLTTDLSTYSTYSFDTAKTLASELSVDIVVLCVFSTFHIPPFLYKQIHDQSVIPTLQAEYEQNCEQELLTFVATHLSSATKISCRVVYSDELPADALAQVAREYSKPLFISAAHGRGAIGQFVLGSNVSRLIQKAPCPVLVVPHNATDK